MKAYKVEIETFSFDWGWHADWKLLGYYTNKVKAETIATEAYNKRDPIDMGDTRITEIEIDTGE